MVPSVACVLMVQLAPGSNHDAWVGTEQKPVAVKSNLDNHKAGTGAVGGIEVDIWLIAGDVEALDSRPGLNGASGREPKSGSGQRYSRELHGQN